MCTCASCEYTDSFAGKSFAEWPRGEPAGPRRSTADYAAHVRYGQQWGRAASGEMHEPKECTSTTSKGTRATPGFAGPCPHLAGQFLTLDRQRRQFAS